MDINHNQTEPFKLDLRSADLSRVMLRKANLSGGNFDKADLSEATLIGADLSNVSLWGTNLSSVLLAEPQNGDEDITDRDPVQGLTQEILDDACADTCRKPRELTGILDAETRKPLCWRGGPCW